MIKFFAEGSGGRVIMGLIFSRVNVENLVNQMPIHFSCEEMNLPEIRCKDVHILYFETEEEAVKFFVDNGFITPDKLVPIEEGKKH